MNSKLMKLIFSYLNYKELSYIRTVNMFFNNTIIDNPEIYNKNFSNTIGSVQSFLTSLKLILI